MYGIICECAFVSHVPVAKWQLRMAAMEHDDLEGCSNTDMSSPFHELVF